MSALDILYWDNKVKAAGEKYYCTLTTVSIGQTRDKLSFRYTHSFEHVIMTVTSGSTDQIRGCKCDPTILLHCPEELAMKNLCDMQEGGNLGEHQHLESLLLHVMLPGSHKLHMHPEQIYCTEQQYFRSPSGTMCNLQGTLQYSL